MAPRILVIEDNEVERLGVSMLLANEGYQVTDAESGQIAVERLLKALPNLIVLDMMMPDVDGWQILEIRRTNPLLRDIPVVIITGASYTDEPWAMGLGAQGFLKKPFSSEALLDKVKRLTRPPA